MLSRPTRFAWRQFVRYSLNYRPEAVARKMDVLREPSGNINLVVVGYCWVVYLSGAHMSGLPLNHQLTDLEASYVRACKTAPVYKMYSLGPRPALIRQSDPFEGMAFAVEVWSLPIARVGTFLLNGVKPPLCIGDVLLEDGTEAKGFLGESYAVQNAEDISRFGGWRAYLQAKK